MKTYYPENVQRDIDHNIRQVFYEYRFNIPDIIEECIGEHTMVIMCGNCGGMQSCLYCGKQGHYVEPFDFSKGGHITVGES